MKHRDFSTREAARICRFSIQMAVRAIDKGLMKGYKLPGSKFRRVSYQALREFMEFYGLATDLLEEAVKDCTQDTQTN